MRNLTPLILRCSYKWAIMSRIRLVDYRGTIQIPSVALCTYCLDAFQTFSDTSLLFYNLCGSNLDPIGDNCRTPIMFK